MNTKSDFIPCIDCITLAVCKSKMQYHCKNFFNKPFDVFSLSDESLFDGLTLFSMEGDLCSIAKRYLETYSVDSDHQQEMLKLILDYIIKTHEEK